jgi:dihydropteroate synthase
MGVVNVTPDSFSDGGDSFDAQRAIEDGLRLSEEGALVVDVGGESTRPGAQEVSAAEERRRILPVVAALAEAGLLVSIDSRKPEVVQAALDAGARIVNDVSGLRLARMRQVAANAGAPAVIMHMQGQPGTMQHAPNYGDVVQEVGAFLAAAAAQARQEGVPDVLLDPGIGFGKSAAHNLTLLRQLEQLVGPGELLLVGASRKATIGVLSGEQEPKRRLPGSLVLHLRAADAGAAVLRVHDVAEHAQALAVWAALRGEGDE